MKNVLLLSLLIFVSVLAFVSCSSDDDLARAEMSFQGVLMDVDYSDKIEEAEESESEEMKVEEEPKESEEPASKTEDGYEYETAIAKALADLGIIGEKSLIKESASVDVSDINYARYKCYEQVKPKIDNRINQLTFNQVLYSLYKNDMENMIKLGYNSPEEIPLKIIKSTVNYYSPDWPYFTYNIVLK